MPQLMRERADTTEGRFEIGEDARLAVTQRCAIGAIALARTGLGVDPALAKSTIGKRGEARRIGAELLDNERGPLVEGPHALVGTQGRANIVPGETGQVERAGFGV